MKTIADFLLYWISIIFSSVGSLLIFLITIAFIIAVCLDTCSPLLN